MNQLYYVTTLFALLNKFTSFFYIFSFSEVLFGFVITETIQQIMKCSIAFY